MKALTIRQPWASAIFLPGGKDVENRTWRAPSVLGQRIAIHAGKGFDPSGIEQIEQILGIRLERSQLPASALIGTAVVAAIVESSASPWFVGPFGFVLEDRRLVRAPLPCGGKLNLWTLPESLERALMDQIDQDPLPAI